MRKKNAPAKALNLPLDARLFTETRAYGLDLSRIAGEAIRKTVRAGAALRWRKGNAAVIDEYNRLVDEQGLFSDHVAGWWNSTAASHLA